MQEEYAGKKKNLPLKRRAVYILPNLFTTASVFLGFLSILFSIQGFYDSAAYYIFFAAFMDGFDGKVARLTGTTSEFGIQYDSLADLLSFGMAPALLVWNWGLHDYGRLGIGFSFVFLACAALRLARFNVAAPLQATQKKFFIGLPSPAAGCALASFVLFIPYYERVITFIPTSIFLLVLTLTVALLMVSRVRYFSFKEFEWGKKHPFQTLVLGLLLFLIFFSMPRLFIFPFGFCYILSGIIYTFIYIPLKSRKIIKTH